jgi:hypothetical protein
MGKRVIMKGTLAVILSLAMTCTACSTAWVSTLNSILAAAAPALINILQIVALEQGQPLNTNLEAKINADATVIKTLAADFAKASSGSAPGICQQLQAGVNTYASDQQLVLQAAHVNDSNTQTKITMLVDLVAGTVSAITAAIPSCQNAAAFRSLNYTLPYNVPTFVDNYNRVLATATGNSLVDGATPKLKLHQHSKVLRVITFGGLN